MILVLHLKSYALQLISSENFIHNKEIIEAVKVHENELQIMVDGLNEIKKEEAYRKEHISLIIEIGEYKKYYIILKIQLFDILKNIKKKRSKDA